MYLYSKLAFIGALFVSVNTFAQSEEDILDQPLMNALTNGIKLESGVSLKNVTRTQAQALATVVIANGYSCNSISSVHPFVMSRGYTIRCNNYNYSYDVKDVGGNLQVTVE